jgi:hypothetical protein
MLKSKGGQCERCPNWVCWFDWLRMPYRLNPCISCTCCCFQLHLCLPYDPPCRANFDFPRRPLWDCANAHRATQLKVCLFHHCSFYHVHRECYRFYEWTPKRVFGFEDRPMLHQFPACLNFSTHRAQRFFLFALLISLNRPLRSWHMAKSHFWRLWIKPLFKCSGWLELKLRYRTVWVGSKGHNKVSPYSHPRKERDPVSKTVFQLLRILADGQSPETLWFQTEFCLEGILRIILVAGKNVLWSRNSPLSLRNSVIIVKFVIPSKCVQNKRSFCTLYFKLNVTLYAKQYWSTWKKYTWTEEARGRITELYRNKRTLCT